MSKEKTNKDEELSTSEKIKVLTVLFLYFLIPTLLFGFIGTKLLGFNPFICSGVGFVFALGLGYLLGLHKPVEL